MAHSFPKRALAALLHRGHDMNWDAVAVALIGALPPTLVAGAAWYQAMRTHKSVNGMKHELVESVRKEAGATATLAEKDAEMIRKGLAVTEAERLRDQETLIKDM